MESLVGITMAFAQSFYLLHLAIIFFPAGEKFKQLGFKYLVRMGRSGKKLSPALA
jgi:hypothetical protein